MDVWMILAIVFGSLAILFYLSTGILTQREIGLELCYGTLCRYYDADEHGHGVYHLNDEVTNVMRILHALLWIVFLFIELIQDGPEIIRFYVLGDT